jgi:hypothetical protein
MMLLLQFNLFNLSPSPIPFNHQGGLIGLTKNGKNWVEIPERLFKNKIDQIFPNFLAKNVPNLEMLEQKSEMPVKMAIMENLNHINNKGENGAMSQ